MRNLKGHKINISPKIVARCWTPYLHRYLRVERTLLSKASKTPLDSYVHPTGAFQIPVAALNKATHDRVFRYLISGVTSRKSIKLGTKYVLRGIDYFPGLENKPNSDRIRQAFGKLREAINIADSATLETNKILYLAILDYIKNYLLIILYALNQILRHIPQAYSSLDPSVYQKFVSLTALVEKMFVKNISTSFIEVVQELGRYHIAIEAVDKFIKHHYYHVKDWTILNDDLIRKIRECNHPIKLYQFGMKIARNFLPRDTILIGLEYGGIELPFVINSCREVINKSSLPTLTANLSHYSTSSNRNAQDFEDVLTPYTWKLISCSTKTVVTLDDSVTTGRTVEKLINLLPLHIERVYFAAVSFTDSNRYHHLTRHGHGGINPYVAESSLFLSRSSFTSTYSRRTYTNKGGVFDKDKTRILRLIKVSYPQHYL